MAIRKERASDIAAAPKEQRLALINRWAAEYAQSHDVALRPRAEKIVALENVEVEPLPVKKALNESLMARQTVRCGLRALPSCAPVNRDHAHEHERKSEFCFAAGNEARNPPRCGHVPMKCWRVACAQVAKKPNHKSGCVNRPADAFGICHPSPPRFSDAGHRRWPGRRSSIAGVAKAKRRRHCPWLTRRSLANRRLTPCPPRRTCCFAPNICSSRP